MKDRCYWTIVGRVRLANGEWRWIEARDEDYFGIPGGELSGRKILFNEDAKRHMRELKAELEKHDFTTKIGKVKNEKLPDYVIWSALFDIEHDICRNDDEAICLQVRSYNRPVAIYYCIKCYDPIYRIYERGW